MGARILRRPLSLGLCALALLGPTWSCLDATEIDLRITTDEPISNIAAPQQAEIFLGTPGNVTTNIPSNTVDSSGSFGDLVVAPSGDIGADMALRVVLGVTVPTSACGQSPQDCIVASRTIRYVPHHKLVLPVQLESRCLGVTCPAGQTCVAGSCVDDSVDTNLCDGGVCGTGTLDDGSSPEAAPVDAAPDVSTCTVTNPATCGTDTCVDLSTDAQHCGACNVDCSGGTCAAGTCTLATLSVAPTCLGIWNGSVYVVTQDRALYTVPTIGGAATNVSSVGDGYMDVATLGEGADLAYSYQTPSTAWNVDEKLHAKSGVFVPTAADRIALDNAGFAWLSLSSGQVGYAPFAAQPTQITTMTGNYTSAWLGVGADGSLVYASLDATQLCKIGTGGVITCFDSSSNPKVTAPTGIAVSDPGSSTPSVYVVEGGSSIVQFDSALTTPSTFATGGTSMAGLAWDKATSTAYAISDGAVFKSSNNVMSVLVKATTAVSRCIVVDANAVYWLQSPGVLLKHAK